MRSTRPLITFVTLLFVAACGGSSDGATSPTSGGAPGTSTGSTSNAITVADNSFSPSATTVTPGTTITWTWSGGSNSHNVRFDDGITSSTQTAGTYARSFAVAGSYPYHCTIHGAAMSGTVTVK